MKETLHTTDMLPGCPFIYLPKCIKHRIKPFNQNRLLMLVVY